MKLFTSKVGGLGKSFYIEKLVNKDQHKIEFSISNKINIEDLLSRIQVINANFE